MSKFINNKALFMTIGAMLAAQGVAIEGWDIMTIAFRLIQFGMAYIAFSMAIDKS